MSHESFERDEDVTGSSDRAFGLVFAAVFLLIGTLPWLFGGVVRPWSLAVAGGFALVAASRPGLLAPLNRLWTRFGLLLHRVVSPLILGLMFFVTVTPIGLLMRAVGKNPLQLRFDRGASTYWIERRPPGPAPDSLDNQF